MSPHVAPARLRRRFMRFHLRDLSLIATLFALFTASVAAAAQVSASIEDAVAADVRALYGIEGFILQNVSAEGTLTTDGVPDASWIAVQQARLAVPGRQESVSLRVLSDPGVGDVPSAIIAGSAPTGPGEIALSQRAASVLGIEPGAQVTLVTPTADDPAGTAVQVIGIMREMADAQAATAVMIDPEQARGQGQTVLVASMPPAQTPLGQAVADRAVFSRPVSSLAQERTEDTTTRLVGPLLSVLPVLGVVIGLGVLILTPALLRRWQPDHLGLIAAGVPEQRIRSLFQQSLLWAAGVGTLLGWTIGTLGVIAAQGPLSAQFGQHWDRLAPAVPPLILLAVLVFCAEIVACVRWGSLSTQVSRRVLSITGGRVSRMSRPPVLIAALLTLVALAAVSVWAGTQRIIDAGSVQVMLILCSLALVALTALVRRALTSRRSGIGAAERATAPVLMTVGALVTLTAVICSAQLASAVHWSRSGAQEEIAAGRAGVLAVNMVPRTDLPVVLDLYRTMGGQDSTTWIIPDEGNQSARILSPTLMDCIALSGEPTPASPVPQPQSCYENDPDAQAGYPVLSDSTTRTEIAPEYAREGTASFIILPTGLGAPDVITGSGSVAAQPATRLGGFLPAAVVPVDSPEAAEMQLAPSESGMVILWDFATLDPLDQARMRDQLARLAPAAEMIETPPRHDPGAQGRLALLTILWSVVMLGLCTAVMRVVGVMVDPVRAIREQGARSRSGGVGLIALAEGPIILQLVLGALYGWGVGWLLSIKDGLGEGALWMIPTACGFLTVLLPLLWHRARKRRP